MEETLSIRKEKHYIAVISLDVKDFRNWILENKLKPDRYECGKFVVGRTTYYCINTICDLNSLILDSIVSTERARENPRYEEILSEARFLKQ